MNRTEVKEKLIYIIKDVVKDWYTGPIDEQTTMADMGCDSMDAIELQVYIENAFRITPEEKKWDATSNLGEWIDLVYSHVKDHLQ